MRKIKTLNKEEFENFCIEMLGKCANSSYALYEVVSGCIFQTLPFSAGVIYQLAKTSNKTIRIYLHLEDGEIIWPKTSFSAPNLGRYKISYLSHKVSFRKIVEKHFYEEVKPN